MPKKLIHPTLHMQIGWGEFSSSESIDGDNVFVFTPAIEAEINFTRYFKTGLGISYTSINFMIDQYYSENDISSLLVNISFKFGWF